MFGTWNQSDVYADTTALTPIEEGPWKCQQGYYWSGSGPIQSPCKRGPRRVKTPEEGKTWHFVWKERKWEAILIALNREKMRKSEWKYTKRKSIARTRGGNPENDALGHKSNILLQPSSLQTMKPHTRNMLSRLHTHVTRGRSLKTSIASDLIWRPLNVMVPVSAAHLPGIRDNSPMDPFQKKTQSPWPVVKYLSAFEKNPTLEVTVSRRTCKQKGKDHAG